MAVGVDFMDGESLYGADSRSKSVSATGHGSVNVTRELILSGGAFNTPQLLKLSGIGPKSELDDFKIPVVVDLPGDRYETSLIAKTESDFTITSKCTFMETLPNLCLEDWKNGSGPITKGVYGTNGIAVAVIKKSSVAEGGPDLLISGAPARFTGYYPGYSSEALSDAHHWAWIVLKAHSRNNAGTVKLRSMNPRDTPIIDFNSFDTGVTTSDADEKDLQAVYEAMLWSRKAFKSLIPLDGDFKNEVWPGPNVTTEPQMKDFIKNEAWGHHASCTCPISADNNPMAVLDSKFRVRGVQGLRIVDASITLPLCIMSEKAADVIIQSTK